MVILLKCRCSSVVEHTLGKGGVESPILFSGTIKKRHLKKSVFFLMVSMRERGLLKERLQNTLGDCHAD